MTDVTPYLAMATADVSFFLDEMDKTASSVVKAPGYFGRIFDALGGGHRYSSMAGVANKALGGEAKAVADLAAERAGNAALGKKMWLDEKITKPALAIGAGGLIAAPGMYYLGNQMGEQNKKHYRNMGFGAGFATGLAAPQVVNNLAIQMNRRYHPYAEQTL